jgi:hypothetical protein
MFVFFEWFEAQPTWFTVFIIVGVVVPIFEDIVCPAFWGLVKSAWRGFR